VKAEPEGTRRLVGGTAPAGEAVGARRRNGEELREPMKKPRLPALGRRRNVRLFVDSGSPEEPPDRWFASPDAALRAFDALADEWKPYAWIIEYRDQATVGGIPLVRNVVHMERGRRTGDEPR
jgi:hypothetical protein